MSAARPPSVPSVPWLAKPPPIFNTSKKPAKKWPPVKTNKSGSKKTKNKGGAKSNTRRKSRSRR